MSKGTNVITLEEGRNSRDVRDFYNLTKRYYTASLCDEARAHELLQDMQQKFNDYRARKSAWWRVSKQGIVMYRTIQKAIRFNAKTYKDKDTADERQAESAILYARQCVREGKIGMALNAYQAAQDILELKPQEQQSKKGTKLEQIIGNETSILLARTN